MSVKRFILFLETRIGHSEILHKLFLEEVKGGARWAYVFGSCLAFLFSLQVITGIVMALHYSASNTQAWGSVVFFQQSLRTGWFIRGLHHWAASFIVILTIIHLFQVFLFGAYQKPREVNWWTGILLLIIILGLALTGYLLPWDQRGYWSTNVVTNIIGIVPLIGPRMREILIGGHNFGSLTLTRFYGLHILILPALFFLVFLSHLIVFRRHGVTPGWWRKESELESTTEPFWPRQVFYDLLFALLVLIVLGAWVIYHKGAPLGPPADPVSNYLARPEWYFLFLFQILKYFKGSWEVVGILIIPLSLLIFLFALPFVDRSQNRSPLQRKTLVAIGVMFSLFLFSFTMAAFYEDRKPVFYYQEQEGKRQAEAALALARKGIPPSGPLDMIVRDPLEHGRKLFTTYCLNCHTLEGLGGNDAPNLTGYLSQTWLEMFLKDPQSSRYYGKTPFKDMDPLHVPEEEVKQLAAYLRSISRGELTPEALAGFAVYEKQDCGSCHGIPGQQPGNLLDLTGYGSPEWLRSFLQDPGQEKFYGEVNQMQGFKDILTPQEIDHLEKMLLSLQNEKVPQ